MHELVIVEGIMKAAIPDAEKHGAKKILAIRLKIGELSGVVPSCIQEYFSLISKGTMAEAAKIEIEKIPITIRCNECGYEGEIGRMRIRCPKCESSQIRILSGKEYFVDSLEVE